MLHDLAEAWSRFRVMHRLGAVAKFPRRCAVWNSSFLLRLQQTENQTAALSTRQVFCRRMNALDQQTAHDFLDTGYVLDAGDFQHHDFQHHDFQCDDFQCDDFQCAE